MVRSSPETISIHAPRKGSDVEGPFLPKQIKYFNPRSPRGERRRQAPSLEFRRNFNPRSPRGERRWRCSGGWRGMRFQSTLPARGATCSSECFFLYSHFNPRSPRGERLLQHRIELFAPKFQSTLPARGATHLAGAQPRHSQNFNPRSPRGERRGSIAAVVNQHIISIHAPREGSDRWPAVPRSRQCNFNPRSPRGERRKAHHTAVVDPQDFNPRSPRGERPGRSLPSLHPSRISIHAPREGSDGVRAAAANIGTGKFQSTLPARGATGGGGGDDYHSFDFNPRSPRGERQQMCIDF